MLAFLKVFESKPSLHSLVYISIVPYNSLIVIDLGFIENIVTLSTYYKILITVDFPDPVGPTTMVVCLVSMVSTSYTTLFTYLGTSL